MGKALKSSLIIGGILVAIIVIVVVGLQFASHRIHNNPRATLLFATSAKTLHGKLLPATLDNITVLADEIAAGPSSNTTAVQAAIIQGQMAAGTYRETYGYLEPTSDTLDLFTNLQREATFIATGYAKLTQALSAYQDGNQQDTAARLAEARTSHDQAAALRQQNTAAIDNLITDTQAKLSQ